MNVWLRFRALLARNRVNREMAEEIQSHLQLQVEQFRAAGLPPAEAGYAAARSFGGVEQIKERCRDQRGWPWFEQFFRDVHLAARGLGKNPGFALAAILVLALGVGVNTATFSVVHNVLLRPLPYPEQERLLVISGRVGQQAGTGVSYANFLDLAARQNSFAALGAVRRPSFSDFGPEGAERVAGAQVSHGLFPALGVVPLRGRLFTAADDRPGAEPAVLIRESYWHRRFGGRDSAVGERLQLSGTLYTITGVIADAVRAPGEAEVWVPLGLLGDHRDFTNRSNPIVSLAVARLKPGVTPEAAQADLDAIAAQLAGEFPAANAARSFTLQSLPDYTFGKVAPMLYVLLGAAGFVLLIACANVANLQLARAHARAREFAVRAALGAGRGRLVRQLLAESLLLGALGCGAGVWLGSGALHAFRAFLPANLPRLDEIGLNGWVLAFAIGASVLTSVVFGLIPAWHASKLDLTTALARGGRTAAPAGGRWRALFIAAEFALTCVLLVGAGLMLRTLANLYRADLGFNPERVVTFNWGWLPLPMPPYDQPAQRVAAIDRALSRLQAIPGVTQVGAVSTLPFTTTGAGGALHIEGAAQVAPGAGPLGARAHTTPGLFAALDIPFLAGRNFDARDTINAPRVAIVDANFATKYFPNGDALGRRFAYGDKPPASEGDWFEIIGIVAPIQITGPANAPRIQTYIAHTQIPGTSLSFTVRTTRPLASVMPAIRAAMRDVDPGLPVFGETTLDALFDANIGTQRLTSLLLGAFAALAVALAACGLYGVVSFNVGLRRREMAVRVALGASPQAVTRLMALQGMRLAALGLLVGLAAALGLTRLLTHALYGVSSFDPWTLAGVSVVLASIGWFATWVPARRAANADPIAALRAE